MVPNCPPTWTVPNCPWCQIVLVPNCPRTNLDLPEYGGTKRKGGIMHENIIQFNLSLNSFPSYFQPIPKQRWKWKKEKIQILNRWREMQRGREENIFFWWSGQKQNSTTYQISVQHGTRRPLGMMESKAENTRLCWGFRIRFQVLLYDWSEWWYLYKLLTSCWNQLSNKYQGLRPLTISR